MVVLPPSSILDLITIDVATENTVQTNLLLKPHFTLIFSQPDHNGMEYGHLFLLNQPAMKIPLEERNSFGNLSLTHFFSTGLNECEVSLGCG